MPKPEFTFRYRVRNSSEYNQALVSRGRLTLWFDETTKEIIAVDVTTSRVHDSKRLPTLLSQVTENIAQVSADHGNHATTSF